jgi:alkylation response protein AidB-like acyl-CoA dehydrogenase
MDFREILNEEQKKIQDEVREFVKNVSKDLLVEMDRDNLKYPKEYVKELAKRNLLGLRFPKKYGGRGLTWCEEVIAIEEIGILGSSLGCLYSLPSIVGEAIEKFGTDEQKEKYLKPTLKGEIFCAEALTEPRGGSDFFGATTYAEKKGKYYYLTGQKRFVVGAEGADYFLVYAKTKLGGESHKSISCFLVEKNWGIEVKYLYGLLGTRGGGTGRIVFNKTPVPEENIILGENRGAEIFYQMMIPERLTSAAGALGIAKAALQIAAKYSMKRKAFNQKIKEFQGVSFKIADSITKLDAARSLVYTTAKIVEEAKNPSLSRRFVSEAKKFATEITWEIVNNSMQILGGIGYTNIYPVEKYLRDARLSMIWTGTNEIMNLIIQHEFYKEILSEKEKMRNVEEDAPEADKIEEKVYE